MSASVRAPLAVAASLGGSGGCWCFYDGLGVYGAWLGMLDWGWTWAPRHERGWRPCTQGRGIMTDDGWVWVPGAAGGPAWVCWRYGNG